MLGIVEGTMNGDHCLWNGRGRKVTEPCASCGSRMERQEEGGGSEGLCLMSKAAEEVCGGAHHLISEA